MMSASLTIGAVLAVLMIIYLSEGLMNIMPRGIVGTAVSGTALRYPCGKMLSHRGGTLV